MSTYRQENINNRPPQLADLGFWAEIRFDPNDNAPTYIGLNAVKGANTATDLNWKIYKLTTASTYTTVIELAYGAWNNRTNLF